MITEIPKITSWNGDTTQPNSPGWFQPTQDEVSLKPIIRCNCGSLCGIGLHHVHADGTVTASFFHDAAPHSEIHYVGGGCGWHVWLKLLDYDGGEFLPKAGS